MSGILWWYSSVWFGTATKQHKNRLQRTVIAAERIIAVKLPSIQD